MQAEEQLVQNIIDDYMANKLVLPSFPEVARKVEKAIQSENADIDSVTKLVQLDPALTVRLMQVANSAIYGGQKKIESCTDAIIRMGIPVTRGLVRSFAIRQMFNSKSGTITKIMEKTWMHSCQVGAISHVLVSQIKPEGLQGERALLAGIVHDIGVLPILRYAEAYPQLIADEKFFQRVLNELRGPLGRMILKKWGFEEDLTSIPEAAEMWMRDTGTAIDYADIVIIAQAHSFIISKEKAMAPPFDEMPAFKKLAQLGLGPDSSIKILSAAKDEIAEVMKLLK